MKFDSLILDVDGTIWNTTEIVSKAWNKAIKESFPQVKEVTAKILQQQFGKPMTEIAENLFSPLSKEEQLILMKKCEEYEQLAIDNNQTDISYEGVIASIKEISKSIPVFIVSNCQSGYIELVCRKNGLQDFITGFTCFGDTGKFKDENIRLIIEKYKLKAPVYVGDTLGDFQACKRADIPFIWAAYGFGKDINGMYAKIEKFEDLKKIIL